MEYKHGQKLTSFRESLRALADGERVKTTCRYVFSLDSHDKVTCRDIEIKNIEELKQFTFPFFIYRPGEEKRKVKRWQWLYKTLHCNDEYGITPHLTQEEVKDQYHYKPPFDEVFVKIPESEKECDK